MSFVQRIIEWYKGIKLEYPRLRRYLGRKVTALLADARPFTLLLPLLGGLFVFAAQMAWDGELGLFLGRLPVMLLAVVSLMFVNAAGNIWTSAFDWREDAVNKPYRPIPKGELSRRTAMMVGAVLFVVAAAIACMLSWLFTVIVAGLSALTAVYSVPPVRIKRFLGLNVGYQGVIRSYGITAACWTVYGSLTSSGLWAMATVVFLYIMAMQHTKDITDVPGDREAGLRTLPIVLGQQGTIRVMSTLAYVPFLVLFAFIMVGWLPLSSLLVSIAVVPVTVQVHVLRSKPSWELGELENSVVWNLFYINMLIFYLAFPLSFWLG